MKNIFISITILLTVAGCKSRVKEQEDSIYSRHLQKHIDLHVITTPMPDKKEEMNLLILNNGDMTKELRVKKILDSLYKHKLIQPLTIVSVDAAGTDFGSVMTDGDAGKQHQQFDDFIAGELYPFAKKKTVIRKFNSVAVCGFGEAALNALDIAWNNDEKIMLAGMFYPKYEENSDVPVRYSWSRKRPAVSIWMTAGADDSVSVKLQKILQQKSGVRECRLTAVPNGGNKKIPQNNFAEFLVWAFPRS